MSTQNYITDLLVLKDNNIIFKENCYYNGKIKESLIKFFRDIYLMNQNSALNVGVVFDDNFEKNDFIISNIKIPRVSEFKTILRLHKHRYLCKHCNKAFSFSTSIVNYGCYKSNNTKNKIAFDLIKKMFSNAQIVIDKFHLTQLFSRSFNKTRIMIIKKHKQHYRKLKRYLKLLLKYREDLDNSVWKRFTCFEHLMTTIDVVDYLINIDEESKQTYRIYQDILYSLKTRNYELLKSVLSNPNNNISSYMKTAVKTLSEFLPYIKIHLQLIIIIVT